ncbi:MBL fold metallo-hydrolase [Candidatus Deferrimicrobium sp.]|uniref:MBL fold metallo-hydrolase n=1 Tax=Candidatus Deferrimicrobium sp. TaxID=3060586 RepID=UPI003C61739C
MPLRKVARDILQLRMPLDAGIDHNNVYLIREDAGWCVFDTGIDSPAVRNIWTTAFSGSLKDGISRIVVSHHHPDHLGLAAWLQETKDAPVYIRPEELAAARTAGLPDPSEEAMFREYFGRNGMSAKDIDWLIDDFMRSFFACAIPRETRTLESGKRFLIGRYAFEILIQGGHSVAQVALHDPSAGILLSGDQMLERITPNVGLWPYGDTDPLVNYFRSLDEFESRDIRFVLPGHDDVYRTDGRRPEMLRAHHRGMLSKFLGRIRGKMTGFELSEAVFGKQLGIDNRVLALLETLAHLQWLHRKREVVRHDDLHTSRYERVVR